MRGPALLALAAVMVMGGGCATPHVQHRTLTVHGELVLAAPQTVGIALVRDRREFVAAAPPSAEQLVGGMIGEFPMGKDPLLVLGVPWYAAGVIAAAVQGGLIAAVSGVDDASAAQSEQAIALAARGVLLDEAVARAVQERLDRGANEKSSRLPDEAPAPETNQRRPRVPTITGGSASTASPAPVTVRVRILFQGLQTRPIERTDLVGVAIAANPPLALVLAVQVLATDNASGDMIGGVSAAYESVPRTITAWSADGAALLRGELERAQREMVDEVAARVRRRE